MLGIGMRIVSYNVRYFGHALKGLASTAKAKKRIADAISGLLPLADVVCLQEVEHGSLRSSVAHRGSRPGEMQLQAFLRHLDEAFRHKGQLMPYQAFYFPAHAYRVGQLKLYTTGLAILVNACTLHVVGHNQNEPWSVTSFGDGAIKAIKQTRILAHLQVETLRKHQFHIFNTHLSLPSPFRRDFWKAGPRFGYAPNQLHEVQQAAQHILRLSEKEPFLLCGDFNAAPASPVYMYLTRELGASSAQETLGQIDLSNGALFPTAGFLKWRMHLDHLFGGKGIEWLDVDGTKPFDDARSPFYGLSDHVPLIANFKV